MLQDMSDCDIDNSYALNVRQFIRLTRYFIDILRQSNNGRIIVISSIWGETGASLETIYSAMKSAQIGFVKALSRISFNFSNCKCYYTRYGKRENERCMVER